MIAQSGIVTASQPGMITFSLLGNRYGIAPGTKYYITGTLAALDTAREWFFDPATSTLYLWAPAGDDPSSHVVEVKRRQDAFDLSGKSNINIGAFNIFASRIKTDMNSSDLVIDGINASYVSHLTRIEGTGSGWWAGWDTGILLHGTNNTLKNCTIAYSAGNGVEVLGTNHKVTNCTIHDVNYLALDSAAVYTHSREDVRVGRTGFKNSGHEFSHNTLYNSARSLIMHEKSQGVKILYNNIYKGMLQTSDGGLTYTWETDGMATELAYNWLHDSNAITSPSGLNFAPGIYLDGGTGYKIHHNVVWDNPGGPGIYVGPSEHFLVSDDVFNNTMWNNRDPMGDPGRNVGTYRTYNNLSDKGFVGTDLRNNLMTSSPQFVNPSAGNFQLQSTSPAINFGTVIPGITDGYVGTAPDAGAYEYGLIDWTAGANTASPPRSPTPGLPPLPSSDQSACCKLDQPR